MKSVRPRRMIGRFRHSSTGRASRHDAKRVCGLLPRPIVPGTGGTAGRDFERSGPVGSPRTRSQVSGLCAWRARIQHGTSSPVRGPFQRNAGFPFEFGRALPVVESLLVKPLVRRTSKAVPPFQEVLPRSMLRPRSAFRRRDNCRRKPTASRDTQCDSHSWHSTAP